MKNNAMPKKRSKKRKPTTASADAVRNAVNTIDGHLESFSYTDSASDEAKELAEALQRQLSSIKYRMNDVTPSESQFKNWFSELFGHINQVLMLCILEFSKIDSMSDRLIDSALRSYVESSFAFEEVLDEWLPIEFKHAAEKAVAYQKYHEGSNATASDDWDVFRSKPIKSYVRIVSGIQTLDAALGGGLNGITVVGGDEGSGKTSFCLHAMVAALRDDPQLGCEFYTLDLPKQKLLEKLFSLVAGLPSAVLRMPSDDRTDVQNNQIDEAERELKDELLPRIRFVEKSNLDVSQRVELETLATNHNFFCKNTNVERHLKIIDLFQSLSEIGATGNANEVDETCLALIQQFVAWSRTSKCPDGAAFLLTSEIRKDRIELTNDDLRGSARLGSTPDNILLLWRTPRAKQTGDTVRRTLKVGKSRDGDAGTIIELEFQHRIGQMTEIAKGAKSTTLRTPSNSSRRATLNSGGKKI